jgi:DNA-binding FadR family transcriptional regulator
MFSGTTAPQIDKLAAVTAQKMEREILKMGWPVGTVLGSEPELIVRYGISRAVLRESVRILEHRTVGRMKAGRGGGFVVTEPQASALTGPLALYIEYLGITPLQVFETRRIIELAAVEAAAANITEEGITALRDMLDMETQLRAKDPNVASMVHVRIAELSGNPALALFVKVLTDVVEARVERHYWQAEELGKHAHEAHTRIIDAITRGDSALARHRMLNHLDALTNWIGEPPPAPPDGHESRR